MRAVVITKHGGPSVLQVQERPDPQLGAGEVRIEVAAAGINFADVMARMGLYQDAPKTPCVVGYEVAGTILELGDGVSDSHPTSRRASACSPAPSSAATPRRSPCPPPTCSRCPIELSFEQGAAIPVNYGTAWAGLIGYGVLQAGERVLVHSAGGGVGIAATQIAKRTGAEVYGTASPGKHERIRELGVDRAIDYTKLRLGARHRQVRRDPRRGRRQELPHQLLAAAPRWAAGRVRRVLGRLRRAQKRGHRAARRRAHAALQPDQADVRIEGRDRAEHADAVEGPRHARPWIEPLRAMLDDGTVNPVVAGAFSFEEAGAAQTMIVERRNVGKVVLRP